MPDQSSVSITHDLIEAVGLLGVAAIGGYCAIKVGQLKEHVNSKLDKLLKLTEDAARAEGKIEGATQEKARADAATVVRMREEAARAEVPPESKGV